MDKLKIALVAVCQMCGNAREDILEFLPVGDSCDIHDYFKNLYEVEEEYNKDCKNCMVCDHDSFLIEKYENA